MFNNIGKKIKALAKFLCILGIILSILIGVLMILSHSGDPQTLFYGILVIVLGSLLSWVGAFFAYGFGELVDNSKKAVEQLERIKTL